MDEGQGAMERGGEEKEDGGDGKAGIWCDKKRKRY